MSNLIQLSGFFMIFLSFHQNGKKYGFPCNFGQFSLKVVLGSAQTTGYTIQQKDHFLSEKTR